MNIVRIDNAQMNAALKLLQEIRDRIDVTVDRAPSALRDTVTGERGTDNQGTAYAKVIRDVPVRVDVPARPSEVPVARSMADALALGHRQALSALLGILDDWIEGAHSNHGAMAHRGEDVGSECWRQFAPADIRVMVTDAARELGVSMTPATRAPVEDTIGRR